MRFESVLYAESMEFYLKILIKIECLLQYLIKLKRYFFKENYDVKNSQV